MGASSTEKRRNHRLGEGSSEMSDATYREIIARLSTADAEVYVPLLEAEADKLSQTLEQYASGVLLREGKRLWYIERSKPKPQSSAQKTPVGRPRIEPSERQRRELAGFLEAVYVKLRGILGGPDFDEMHGKDYERLGELMKTKDLTGLQMFAKDQPWQKTRSGR